MTDDNEVIMSHGSVRYRRDGAIATVTLDRPTTLNAMNDDLMLDLNEALGRAADDTAVRALVLTGAGRGFCSGADLNNVAAGGVTGGEGAGSDEAAAAIVAGMDDVFHPAIRTLADLPVPTVARVNGVAAGGGVGLALGCDVVIAARSARFVATFGPRLGIVPDLGTTFHLPHRIGQARARGMALLGDPVSADEAESWGLIWAAVDDDALDEAVAGVAGRLASASPDALVSIRQALAAAGRNTLDAQLDLERDYQAKLIPRNMVEGAMAFLERREPQFPGRGGSQAG